MLEQLIIINTLKYTHAQQKKKALLAVRLQTTNGSHMMRFDSVRSRTVGLGDGANSTSFLYTRRVPVSKLGWGPLRQRDLFSTSLFPPTCFPSDGCGTHEDATKRAISEQVRKSGHRRRKGITIRGFELLTDVVMAQRALRHTDPLLYPQDTRLERTGGAHGGIVTPFQRSLVQRRYSLATRCGTHEDATNPAISEQVAKRVSRREKIL